MIEEPELFAFVEQTSGETLVTAAQPAPWSGQERNFPADEFEKLRAQGWLIAPLDEQWGTAPGTHRKMLDALRQTGGRDLSTGRLYEGHVNALMLIAKFGDVGAARKDLEAGRIFGVWNTDAPKGVRAWRGGEGFQFTGKKAFGSGAGSLMRPIVTAEVDGEGRMMFVLPMEMTRHSVDYCSWKPLGMEGSDSFTVDFAGAEASVSAVLGAPGDYYRQPAFSGGAIRFAAVQVGAVERLAADFVKWLQDSKRTDDPYQLARVGEVQIEVESGRQWIERAAVEAELNFDAAGEPGIGRMIHVANMTRLAIERICLSVMELVTRGVGARGLLGTEAFEKQLRDLSMYLRQPAPDQALAEVGRRALAQ